MRRQIETFEDMEAYFNRQKWIWNGLVLASIAVCIIMVKIVPYHEGREFYAWFAGMLAVCGIILTNIAFVGCVGSPNWMRKVLWARFSLVLGSLYLILAILWPDCTLILFVTRILFFLGPSILLFGSIMAYFQQIGGL